MAFKWLRKNKKNTTADSNTLTDDSEHLINNSTANDYVSETDTPSVNVKKDEPSNQQSSNTNNIEPNNYLQRLKSGLAKTSAGFSNLFLGKKAIDDELLEDLEVSLLTADVGMEVTQSIIDNVSSKSARRDLQDSEAVRQALNTHMLSLLAPYEQSLQIESDKPFVILMVGINGAGKTTTIGKLAKFYQNQQKQVMLAAGDTFRAAAVEQLQTWGERNQIPVIAQATGADSASVAYDALQSAIARHIDVLIIDTAGRLHTQDHLMKELSKIKRVLQKIDNKVPQEIMLVIDAGNGQNALRQAIEFNKIMDLSSVTVTKMDGTAKGGIIFAITNELKIPIRFIGIGEKIDDLRSFNAQDFVNALLYSDK